MQRRYPYGLPYVDMSYDRYFAEHLRTLKRTYGRDDISIISIDGGYYLLIGFQYHKISSEYFFSASLESRLSYLNSLVYQLTILPKEHLTANQTPFGVVENETIALDRPLDFENIKHSLFFGLALFTGFTVATAIINHTNDARSDQYVPSGLREADLYAQYPTGETVPLSIKTNEYGQYQISSAQKERLISEGAKILALNGETVSNDESQKFPYQTEPGNPISLFSTVSSMVGVDLESYLTESFSKEFLKGGIPDLFIPEGTFNIDHFLSGKLLNETDITNILYESVRMIEDLFFDSLEILKNYYPDKSYDVLLEHIIHQNQPLEPLTESQSANYFNDMELLLLSFEFETVKKVDEWRAFKEVQDLASDRDNVKNIQNKYFDDNKNAGEFQFLGVDIDDDKNFREVNEAISPVGEADDILTYAVAGERGSGDNSVGFWLDVSKLEVGTELELYVNGERVAISEPLKQNDIELREYQFTSQSGNDSFQLAKVNDFYQFFDRINPNGLLDANTSELLTQISSYYDRNYSVVSVQTNNSTSSETFLYDW